jgi:hypothetical protein
VRATAGWLAGAAGFYRVDGVSDDTVCHVYSVREDAVHMLCPTSGRCVRAFSSNVMIVNVSMLLLLDFNHDHHQIQCDR